MSKEERTGLYKRGKIYWFAYTRDRKQCYKSTKSSSFAEALIIRQNYLNNIFKPVEIENKYLFDFVALNFLEDKKRTARKNTIISYKYLIHNIIKFFTSKIINDIVKLDIKQYENFRLINGVSEGLLIKELKLLKSIFNYAFENDLIKENLFDRYNFNKCYKDYEVRERYLSIEECKLIVNNCNPYLQRLVICLLETGLRINEALSLLFTDVCFDKNSNINFLRIRKEISKNKKERFVPLSKIAMEQINKQKIEFSNSAFIFTDSNGNFYKTTPKKALATAFKKAGIKPAGFHIFRKTFASLKLQNGGDLKAISDMLGHSSLMITQKAYAFNSLESLARLIEK